MTWIKTIMASIQSKNLHNFQSNPHPSIEAGLNNKNSVFLFCAFLCLLLSSPQSWFYFWHAWAQAEYLSAGPNPWESNAMPDCSQLVCSLFSFRLMVLHALLLLVVVVEGMDRSSPVPLVLCSADCSSMPPFYLVQTTSWQLGTTEHGI